MSQSSPSHLRKADAAFARYCAHGDPADLAEVFDRTAGRLLAAAAHLCRDQASAEDVVQATFLAAMRAAPGFRPGAPVMPWLMGILGNRVRDLRRQKESVGEAGAAGVDPRAADPARSAVDAEGLRLLEAAVERLPGPYREVLSLRLAHGLSIAEIAHALDRPLNTVKSQLQRGEQRLRSALPRSLLGVLALACVGGDGLAACRARVLAAAGTGTAIAPASFAAMLTIKKPLPLLTALLILAGLAVVFLPQVLGLAPDSATSPPTWATRAAEAAAEGGGVEGAEPARVAVSAAAADKRAAQLRVLLRWKSDGLAARGIACRVYPAELDDGRLHAAARTADLAGLVFDAALPPGRYRAFVSRSCHAEIEIAAGEERELIVAVPDRGKLAGRVISLTGEPLAGAQIRNQDPRQGGWSLLAVCDEDGRFEARAIAGMMWVQAHKPGFGRSRLRSVIPGFSQRLEDMTFLVAEARAALELRLRDAQGDPLAGAAVRLDSADPPGMGSRSQERSRVRQLHAVTDAEGKLRFADLSPGVAELEIHAAGHCPVRRSLRVAATGATRVQIELAAAPQLSLQVRDAAGHAVAGALCRVLDPRERHLVLPRACSDAAGRCDLDAAPAGHLQIAVNHPEKGRALREVHLRPAQRLHLEIQLEPGGPLLGRVVGPDGAGVEGLWVRARLSGKRTSYPDQPEERSAESDAQGRFRIESCVAQPYQIEVFHREGGRRTQLGERRDVRPGDAVEISVTAMPAADARIIARLPRPPALRDVVLLAKLLKRDPWVHRSVRLPPGSEDFDTGPIPAGRYSLQFQISGAGGYRSPAQEVQVGPGERLDLGHIQLPAPTRLRLEVRHPGTVPPLVVRIRQLGAEAPARRFTGFWHRDWLQRFSRIPTGEVEVEIAGNSMSPRLTRRMRIRPAADNLLRLDLPLLPRVRFALTDPPGMDPPAAWRLEVTARDGSLGEEVHVQHGARVLRALPPGRYRVTLLSPGELSLTRDFVLDAAVGPEILELQLRPE